MKYAKNELVPLAREKLVNVQLFLAVELIHGESQCYCCFTSLVVKNPVQIYILPFTFESNIQASKDCNKKAIPIATLDLVASVKVYGEVDPTSLNRQLQQK